MLCLEQMIDRISCAVKDAKWTESFIAFGHYDFPECKSQKYDDRWLEYKDDLFIDVDNFQIYYDRVIHISIITFIFA